MRTFPPSFPIRGASRYSRHFQKQGVSVFQTCRRSSHFWADYRREYIICCWLEALRSPRNLAFRHLLRPPDFVHIPSWCLCVGLDFKNISFLWFNLLLMDFFVVIAVRFLVIGKAVVTNTMPCSSLRIFFLSNLLYPQFPKFVFHCLPHEPILDPAASMTHVAAVTWTRPSFVPLASSCHVNQTCRSERNDPASRLIL